MTLRQTLDALNVEDRKRLMEAFNQGETCVIRLPGGRYIGVNTFHVSGLMPDSDIPKDSTWSQGSHGQIVADK